MENDSNKIEGLFKDITSKVSSLVEKINSDYKQGIIDPLTLEEIRKNLKFLRKIRKPCTGTYDEEIFSVEIIIMLRKFLLVPDKLIRLLAIKILRFSLEIKPNLGIILKKKMFPLIICKIFEDHKSTCFEERLECFKLINSWLKFSDSNFPLIFCQGILAITKGQDEYFKKGGIEFIRNLCVKKPEHANIISGFKILINSLLDENCIEFSDNIFYTLLFIINSTNGRKFFNNLSEFFKIFSIFTKSDFSVNQKNDKDNQTTEERNKLEVQLVLSKRIIEKLIKTWPGYSILMGNYMAIGSIIESLNTDTNIIIKRTVLDMIKEFVESDYQTCDNFTNLTSGDEFYVNKIYLAYILQGLHNNNLYHSLMKFIEKENNPLSEYAQKIALKFTILYSKLSNIDLQLPYLNEKLQMNSNYSNTLTNKMNINKIEVINTKIKIMNLLDQTFYHFSSKEISNMDIKDLSDIVVLAMNTVVNMQNIKKYNNQYPIDVSKKELYLIDDNSFQTLLKNSKILEHKDFNEWDWKRIDEILDIVEYQKDFIKDLFKQRFFKKLLYVFMPSKNLFVSLAWNSETFIYSSVGAKFFKILSNSQESIKILDTSPEENFFAQNKSWYEDVSSCLENLFIANKNGRNLDKKDNSPFCLKRVCKTMSRQIFVFLGMLSQSVLGEDYLFKKGFYSLIRKALTHSGKFDYIFTNLIDNLNFNTKNAVDLIQDILETGSKRIKRYVFEHIRCLFKFGKEVLWSFKNFKFTIDHDQEISKIVINILSSLFTEGKYIDDFLNAKPLIKKMSLIQKDIIYLMMRNKDIYDSIADFIEEEIKNLDIINIIESYANDLEENMNEIFNADDAENKYYFLNINLPKIENVYENFTELFWIKQLPFNVNIGILDESGHSNTETLVLNTYLEFHDSHKLILYSKVNDDIKINTDRHLIKIICMLGDHFIDNSCKMIYHANFLNFDQNDFKSMTLFYKNNNKEEQYFRVEKEGVVINFTRDSNCRVDEYILYSIYFYIKINPAKKQSLKTPINLLTELVNTEKGTSKLIEIEAIPKLLSYLFKDGLPAKCRKSVLWILAKICNKPIYGKFLNDKYQILDKLVFQFSSCEDYAMKGTISYVLCYIAQNKELRYNIEILNWQFFFNSDICFPKNMDYLYLNISDKNENRKFFDDLDKINKYVTLNEKCTEIYNNISNLLITISTYKQSSEKLKELFKNDKHSFNDPNLLVKIYSILSTYKYRQSSRTLILSLFEGCYNSNEILDSVQQILDKLGEDIF